MDAPSLLKRIFTAGAVLELGVVLVDLAGGGFNVTAGGIRISSEHSLTPFRIGILCASVAIWLHERSSPGASLSWLDRHAKRLALVAAAATFVTGSVFGARVAGGADSYGYVSEALLWAKGNLVVPEPMATIDAVVTPAAAPLGYRLGAPGTIVPIYSPGYPMLMAAVSLIGGLRAMYLVVPALGALSVWLTYWIGVRLAGPLVGLSAAIVFACSPMFLFQLLAPMSDVPVTAWWLLSIACAISDARRGALLAGLAAGAAIVTRPNLVPLAVAVAVLVYLASAPTKQRSPFRRLAEFSLGIVPACAGIALLYNFLYGSPFATGYGSLDTIFKPEWVRINLSHYLLWLIQVHSPGILLAFAAPFTISRTRQPEANRSRSLKIRLALLLYGVMVLLCYISYVPMNGWPFVRFLLPAIPILFILASDVVGAGLSFAPSSIRGAATIAVLGLIAGGYVRKAGELGAFATAEHERRFVAVGAYGEALPANAVVLSGMHSGSFRMYGHRPTLRWDQIGPRDLTAVIEVMQAHGYELFVLLESDEEPLFRERFSESSAIGRLDWAPRLEYQGPPVVRVYATSRRLSP